MPLRPHAASSLAAAPGGAQSSGRPLNVQRGYLPLDSSSGVPAALTRRVTLQSKDVPLERALEAIARQAGLGRSYSDEVVQSRTRVSLQVTGVSAVEALRQAAGAGEVRAHHPDGDYAERSRLDDATHAALRAPVHPVGGGRG